MSIVENQRASYARKNGVLSETIEGKPVPMMSTYDTLTLAAYWFSAMRRFFQDQQCEPAPWAVANRSGTRWTHSTSISAVDAAAGAAKSSLDDYLSLAPYNWLEGDRPNSEGWDDRFMPRPMVTGIDACAAVRTNLLADRSHYSIGTVWTLYSGKQSSRDGAETFLRHIRQMMSRWESLAKQVGDTAKYKGGIISTSPGPTASGEQAKALWNVVYGIDGSMALTADVYKSMPSWDTWVSDTASRIKSGTETIIKEGADATGQAAAWAANVAGEASGKAFKGFLEGIGLWGLAFVAAIIYMR